MCPRQARAPGLGKPHAPSPNKASEKKDLGGGAQSCQGWSLWNRELGVFLKDLS